MDAPVSPVRHARPVGPFASMARSISLALGAGRRDHLARLWPETGGARPSSPAPRTAPVLPAFVPGQTPFAAEALPAEAALRASGAEAARGRTRLTFAVAPGLMLRAAPVALGEVLRDVVGGAVRRSPHGGGWSAPSRTAARVRVCLTDGRAGTGEVTLAGLSEVTQGIVALHGGTLEARHRGGFATVVLCLPTHPGGPAVPAARGLGRGEHPPRGRRHRLAYGWRCARPFGRPHRRR